MLHCMTSEPEQQVGPVGEPDGFGRLWTPHRIAYIQGEGKPSGPGADDGCPFCAAPGKSDEDALIENVQRDDLTELEQAQAIQGLITSYGYSQRQVAARIGKTQGFISQRLSLMKLREDIQEALADGRVSIEDARRIARLPKDEQLLPGEADAAATVPAARKEKRARDYGVIKIDSRGTPDDVVEALRRHLAPATLDRIVELLGR